MEPSILRSNHFVKNYYFMKSYAQTVTTLLFGIYKTDELSTDKV